MESSRKSNTGLSRKSISDLLNETATLFVISSGSISKIVFELEENLKRLITRMIAEVELLCNTRVLSMLLLARLCLVPQSHARQLA